ncbi:MAG: M1 family metallopeptidase [Chloroflexaceae bacterium]
MRYQLVLLLLLLLLTACGGSGVVGDPDSARPTGTPTDVPSATAVPAARLGLATLAAATPTGIPAPTSAPTGTPTPLPTATLTPSPQPTLTPTPDIGAAYAPAMRPAFVGDIAAHADLPRYSMHLDIAPGARQLTGSLQISFPNTTGQLLNDVALRLYPNFPRDLWGKGGAVRMDITRAAVDGLPVTVSYAAQETALLLPLAQPLAPGATTILEVGFTATFQPGSDGTFPLPSYYPLLAVHDGDGWRLDVTTFPDRVFSTSALYTVQVTVPAGYSVVASGSTVATYPAADGAITYDIRTGPVRQFALTVGDFVLVQDAAGEVAVNVYTARGSSLDAAWVARISAAALATFERRFGPYPYRELDVHLLPGAFDGGDEYPGLIFVYSDAQVDAGTRYVTAHEVAHQWWFALVGNDIFRQPWLDEAFAQYSGIIYAEDVEGAAVAQADWEREVMLRYRGAQADGDLPVGLAITDFPNFNVYYRTVYGKGAVFLATLRQELGDELFFAGLQTYYERYRYDVATTADVQQVFEEVSGRNLDALFGWWVE